MSAAPLTSVSDRLRDVPGFPKRPGRPRKTVSVPPERKPAPRILVQQPLEAAVLPRPVPTSSVNVALESRPALPPRLLGPRAAGAYLGVSSWTARQLVKRRKLRRVKLPGIVSWLVDRSDLDALIKKAKAR